MTSVRSVVNPEAAVLAAAKDMLRRGLVEGTAGNISARREDGNLVITPSAEGANGSVYLMLLDVGAKPPVIASTSKSA